MTKPTLPPLPMCWDYVYLWDGPYGARKFTTAPHNGRNCDSSQMVYTADQMQDYAIAAIEAIEASQPLTEEQIGAIHVACGTPRAIHLAFARAIEAAHGITPPQGNLS